MSSQNNTLTIPINYGTVSACSGKKGESYLYKWLVYLRHLDNLDLSFIIDSVTFVLHESFTNTLRVFRNQPYLVME